jgi:hypothetical protein
VEADRAAVAVPAPVSPHRWRVRDRSPHTTPHTPHSTPQGKEVIAVKKIVVRKLETIKTTRPVMYDPRLCWVA